MDKLRAESTLLGKHAVAIDILDHQHVAEREDKDADQLNAFTDAYATHMQQHGVSFDVTLYAAMDWFASGGPLHVLIDFLMQPYEHAPYLHDDDDYEEGEEKPVLDPETKLGDLTLCTCLVLLPADIVADVLAECADRQGGKAECRDEKRLVQRIRVLHKSRAAPAVAASSAAAPSYAHQLQSEIANLCAAAAVTPAATMAASLKRVIADAEKEASGVKQRK